MQTDYVQYHTIIYELGDIDIIKTLGELYKQTVRPSHIDVICRVDSKYKYEILKPYLDKFLPKTSQDKPFTWTMRVNVNVDTDNLSKSLKSALNISKYNVILLCLANGKLNPVIFDTIGDDIKNKKIFYIGKSSDYEYIFLTRELLETILFEDEDFLSLLKEVEEDNKWTVWNLN